MPTFAATILGNTGVGTTLDSGSSNTLNGSKINVGSTGVLLTSISVRVGNVDASPNNQYQLAVYTDNGGAPGTLVAQSTSGTLVANDWNTLPISATLQPNTSYWLMYNTNGRTSTINNMYYNNGTTGQGAYSSSGVTFGTWPATFPGAKLSKAFYSLYATGIDSVPNSVPPSVSITAPSSGSTVTGKITLSATASDDVSVPSVQFQIDSANFGAPIAAAPYDLSWDTQLSSNGTHTLTAIAIDGSGNKTTSAPVTVTVSNTNLKSQIGEWSPVMNWPLVAIHASLLKNGKVLVWDDEEHVGLYGQVHPKLWDPVSNVFTDTPVINEELFCAGHVNLADGRLLSAGGHLASAGESGIKSTYVYDADANTWNRTGDMAYARWYPALTKLSDGRVAIVSGQITSGVFADVLEIYDPTTGLSTAVPSINTSQMHEGEYPADFHLPNGTVLAISPEHGPVQLLDAEALTWTNVNTTPVLLGSAVQYRPGKILMSGGAQAFQLPSTGLTAVLDMNTPAPTWRTTASMSSGRYMHNLVMLPTGDVLAVGGSKIAYERSTDGVLPSEIWDPVLETWTTVASLSTPRDYHSTALLLPDGRVLSAGGGHLASLPSYFSAEVYSPPYLFKGSRPTITNAPNSVPYGTATFTVNSPDADNIASVSLIALGSVTHSTDMNQFYTELSFTKGNGQLSISAPQNGDQVPAGYYMLFIVDKTGVPSVARIMKIGSATVSTPPSSPTLTSIAVTPTSPSIAVGATQQFTATGTYSDSSTQDLTNQVAWTSEKTAVATISASGLATGVSAGSTTISAALGGVSGSAALTVQSSTPPSSSSTTGLSTQGSVLDSGDSNYLNGSKVTTSNGGTISSMSVYVGGIDSLSGNQSYQLAIYTDNANTPGTLVASSATGTLMANSWNTLPISATLQPNTSYWLMYNTNGRTSAVNNMYYNNGTAGQGAYSSSGVTFGTWPATFTASKLSKAIYSLYATFGP
ncbi:MAG: galactose oxidase-like domain-containing protein [Candidatus Saccharimonadales bacterium]